MKKDDKIFVTGASGMVGSALIKELRQQGYSNIITRSSKELDLKNQEATKNFFDSEKPEYVFHLAARVGGIAANIQNPVEFLADNLLITVNVINSARESGVKKLLNLGSSCIYPKNCNQPMNEEDLLTGLLEPTNEGYALSKIAALKLCEYSNKQYGTDFISLMPPNLYGPGDHFDSEKSHVISALISKFYKAKNENKASVEIWGTGKPRREFLFVSDLVDAMIFFMKNYSSTDLPSFINVGSGSDISIKELAELLKEISGYDGELVFNIEKPDGMIKKLLDISNAKQLGWSPKTNLREGLVLTYNSYANQLQKNSL